VGHPALLAPVDTSPPVVWLPPAVAADISGYGRKRLTRMGDRGELTVKWHGAHRRFRKDEIEALVPGGAA
jgi:hypothetical protein